MKRLSLNSVKNSLSKFDKIIVTGPPRSGTTIAGLIMSNALNYKFIDESFYDANNSRKFIFFINLPNRKMVIHTTAFLKSLPNVSDFINSNNIAVVLIKRNIDDIMESFRNSEKFTKGIETSNGIFTSIDQDSINIILKHYDYDFKNDNRRLPEVIYDYFQENSYKFNNVFELEYKKLNKHKLFIKKEVRRKKFRHIKQVNLDPYYLLKKKGILVI